MKEFVSKNDRDTLKFARDFSKNLKGGEVICLYGDLGRGKTVFAKGIAEGLGVKKTVASPTFVIMKLYDVKKKNIRQLCHVDAYRMQSANEMAAIGLPEYLGRDDTICLIEWPEKIKEILPEKRTEVWFELGKGREERKISIKVLD